MNLSSYNHSFSLKNKLARVLWVAFGLIFFRPFASRFFKKWRVLVLKCFGAELQWSSHIYASVKIWAPWHFKMGSYSTLGPNVNCYNQGKITIGNNTVISQYVHLCASSHDYTKADFPLILCPITIGDGVWVAADAFVGPGVQIEDNVVVAARAVVTKNISPNQIVGGNPAKFIKKRN